MSRLAITAIERLGAPAPEWPSIYGHAATTGGSVSDVAAIDNGCRTLDLTPYTLPVVIENQMEKSLTKGTWTRIQLSLKDADGSLATQLGPGSTSLGSIDRYFGPYIAIDETWGMSNKARRFLGVIDDQSIEWDENTARTTCTVYHAAQLLADRLASNVVNLLRPLPKTESTGTSSFIAQSPERDMAAWPYTPYVMPPGDGDDDEVARWTEGRVTWLVWQSHIHSKTRDHNTWYIYETFIPAPALPSSRIDINGQSYIVDGAPTPTLFYSFTTTTPTNITTSYFTKLELQLSGDHIDLTTAPTNLVRGNSIEFGYIETQLAHYYLAADVPAPSTDSDGQDFLRLDSVDGLIAGDDITVIYTDSTSGKPRKMTTDFLIVDVDPGQAIVYLAAPVNNAIPASGTKIRRNSSDPTLIDVPTAIAQLAAPFAIDTSTLVPFQTSLPVATWQHIDLVTGGNPYLYGIHDLCVFVPGAMPTLCAKRMPALDPSIGVNGNWTGNWLSGWTWNGGKDTLTNTTPDSLILEHRAPVTQWPGANGPHKPPVLYIEGNISGGAIPPNGWGHRNSSVRDWKHQGQPMDSIWTGSAITRTLQASSAEIPSQLVAYAASTAVPGRYTVTTDGWTFEPHTGDATWGSSSNVAPSGLPSGSLLALGMWPYPAAVSGHMEHQEGLCVLSSVGLGGNGTNPNPIWSSVSLTTFSCGSAGVLTKIATTELESGAAADGIWAVCGGLVLQRTIVSLDGDDYPHSSLYLVSASGIEYKTVFPGCEILPSTVIALELGTIGNDTRISGWSCIALETYDDGNGRLFRRSRLVQMDDQLNVVNGDLIDDVDAPGNLIRLGDVLTDPAPNPDQSLRAQLVCTRSADSPNQAVGFFGSRTLSLDYHLPHTAERIALSSDSTLTCLNVIEKLAASTMMTALPAQDGSITLCNRQVGYTRTRTQGAYTASFFRDEHGSYKSRPSAVAYINNCNVTYSNPLTGKSETIQVNIGNGGRDMDINLDLIAASATYARAIGVAYVSQFGPIPQSRSMVLQEINPGSAVPDLAPTFWADWSAGDLLLPDPVTSNPVNYWKLLHIQHDFEKRRALIEISRIPQASVLP